MLNLPLLALGAVGVVSVVGHIVGPRLAELIAAVESGDLVKARAVNESLLPVYTGIFRTQGVILVKAALRAARPARRAGAAAAGRRDPRAGRAAAARPRRRRHRAVSELRARTARAASASEARDRPQPHLELKAPPPLPEGGLRVMALGGLGEIGRNMAVLEFDGRLLVIDCGVLFPEAEQPGVDLILPDFGVIEHRLDDIDAVVLTHGHEDHIGAVPYLLRHARRHPAGRLPVHPRPGRGEAARAPDRPDAGRGRGRRRPRRRAVPLRVRLGQPLDPRRARRRRAHPGRAPSCTPATSRWTSCRWTAS